MDEAITAVAGVGAVALTRGASLAARQGLERRQRRLRWLASLRDAQRERDPDAEARRELALLDDNRERIAAALETIDEFGRFEGALDDPGDSAPGDSAPGGTITAADLACSICAEAARSLRVQAHLGAASVRRLVGDGTAGDAVNGV